MTDYISRADAMAEFREDVKRANENGETPTWNDAVSLIGSLPSAEAVTVHEDGTLEVTVPNAQKVGRVLVIDTDSHIGGGLFYQYDAVQGFRGGKIPPKEMLDGTVLIPKHQWLEMERALAELKSKFESTDAVQGEWEHWGSPFSDESGVIDTIVCSVCGARFIEPKDEPKGEYNFCPNCGARMENK